MPSWWLLDYEYTSSEECVPPPAGIDPKMSACASIKSAVEFALEGKLDAPNIGVAKQGVLSWLNAAIYDLEYLICLEKQPSGTVPGNWQPDKEKIAHLISVMNLLVGSLNYLGVLANSEYNLAPPEDHYFLAHNLMDASLTLGCADPALHKKVICGLLTRLKLGLDSSASPEWVDSTLALIKQNLVQYDGWAPSYFFLNFSAASASEAEWQKFKEQLAAFQASFDCSAPPAPKPLPHQKIPLSKKIFMPMVVVIGVLLVVGLGTIGFVVQDSFEQTFDDDSGMLPGVTVTPGQPVDNGPGDAEPVVPAQGLADPDSTPTSGGAPSGASGQAAVVCGDGTCTTSSENSDLCPEDCQCVDDGVCAPGEGAGCLDCGANAGTCGAPCADASQCAAGFTCADGFCWGGQCSPTRTGSTGDGGSGTGSGSTDGSCPCSCTEVCPLPDDPSSCTTTCADCNGDVCRP